MANYRNYYDCSRCGNEWTDDWSCCCNDKCSVCNAEIEPSHSKQLLFDFEFVTPKFIGDGDWDHHVLWVSARNRQIIEDFISTLNEKGFCVNALPDGHVDEPTDIDFTLPDDANAMRARIVELMKEAACQS